MCIADLHEVRRGLAACDVGTPRRRLSFRSGRLLLGGILAAASVPGASIAATPVRGLPFTSFYPYEQIADVTRASQLTFDPHGRVAVVQNGAYVVFNDTAWIDLADHSPDGIRVAAVAEDADGARYFGAQSAWGRLVPTADGKLRGESMVPDDCPNWAANTSFTEIVPTSGGIYFAGWNGVVFWDRKTKQHTYFPVEGVARLFEFDGNVYVSSHTAKVQRIDVAAHSLETAAEFAGLVLDHAVPLSGHRLLFSTLGRRLFVLADHRIQPWGTSLGTEFPGRITALHRLLDGYIALCIGGRGLFVVAETGEIKTCLTTTPYRRIVDLASNEVGILWAATDRGVAKVIYASPVSIVGEDNGVPIGWPQVVRCGDRLIIASSGRLYEPTVSAAPSGATTFHLLEGQPGAGTWAIAAQGDRMLAANTEMFAWSGARFAPIIPNLPAARLVMPSPDLCFVIGSDEIGALAWRDGRWTRCAPSIAGVGYPYIVHAGNDSAWLELGPNHVARVSLSAAHLTVQRFDTFPWRKPRWVNVSVIGDTVMFAAEQSTPLLVNERTGAAVNGGELRRFLAEAPFPVTRLLVATDGTYWASHQHGIFTAKRETAGYRFDTRTYDVIHEQNPLIRELSGGDIWMMTGDALYHVERIGGRSLEPRFKPTIVSFRDSRAGVELLARAGSGIEHPIFPYAQNSINVSFFAGSYASRRPPSYEYRLNESAWSNLGLTSSLALRDLREGRYHLDVRLVDSRGIVGSPLAFDFAIAPPWYRSPWALALDAVAAITLLVGAIRFALQRARARNQQLERVVVERTQELRVTMEKLSEETRNSATLAERQRLAGEIHDSIQQWLSGLMLQLDATLRLSGLPEEIESRLAVARRMVSFTRQEVQHAVWDMESPLLEQNQLGDALRQVAELSASGSTKFDIRVFGESVEMSPSATHHLLRIAQEAINNALRHGAATQIELMLRHEPGAVFLSITDNGSGFDPLGGLAKRQGHFGLQGLRTRAEKLGGILTVTSTPGKGTTVAVEIPLAQNVSAHGSSN